MRHELSFDCPIEDTDLIYGIVKRAERNGIVVSYPDTVMDLTVCHCNGCPLDLQRMLHGNLENLAHDIYGIHRHLNRTTGKLENCFWPRMVARKEVTALCLS